MLCWPLVCCYLYLFTCILHRYFAYLAVLRTSGSVSLTQKFMLSYLSELIICDLLIACVFAKATFTVSSVSEIWILDKVFLLNLNRTGNASIILFVIFKVLHCCVFLRNFPWIMLGKIKISKLQTFLVY